jgi:SP family general alpha glucoside:H+ symporter-like MFS transporter
MSSPNPNDEKQDNAIHLGHIEATAGEDSTIANDWKVVTADGRQATIAEHNLTLKQAIKKYPRAIMWSVFVSLAIIMEGYDIVLMGSLFGQKAFLKRYGNYYPDIGEYQLSAPWQSALGNAPNIGAIFGALANGYWVHYFGYRRVLLASLIAVVAFIFISFFATSVEMLLVGEILCGLPWGVFATMAPAYASEVCPVALRGYLTVYVNLCWAFGQLIAAGVMEGFQPVNSKWAYKAPFAVQWAWPVPLFCILFFAPESPWWLVSKGKIEEAEKTVMRLTSKSMTPTDAKQIVAMMVHTHEIELEVETGTNYFDCFKGVNLRRTEIACVVFGAEIFSGLQLGGNPTYFFEQAGVPDSNAFKFSVGGLGLASIGTILSWFLIAATGRRTIFVGGLFLSAAFLCLVGILSAASSSSGSSYAQAGIVMFWMFLYYSTIGPVSYAIISETSAIKLRNKSVCLARITYYLSAVVCATVSTYMINPTEGNWKGKSGFFWGGTCFVCFIWAFFRLPETKGRTYEELDILFANGVKARDFSSCVVDAYAEDETSRVKRE